MQSSIERRLAALEAKAKATQQAKEAYVYTITPEHAQATYEALEEAGGAELVHKVMLAQAERLLAPGQHSLTPTERAELEQLRAELLAVDVDLLNETDNDYEEIL